MRWYPHANQWTINKQKTLINKIIQRIMKHTHRLTGWHAYTHTHTMPIRNPQNHKREHCITTCQHSHNQQYNKSAPRQPQSTQNETNNIWWFLTSCRALATSLSSAHSCWISVSRLRILSASKWPEVSMALAMSATRVTRSSLVLSSCMKSSNFCCSTCTHSNQTQVQSWETCCKILFHWERKCVINEHPLFTKARDDLRKSRGLHSVSAYGHGPVHIGPCLRV